ncbi:outer membrane protein [Salinarimonas soli]|uniref:Porin family protein n=1 Tax=Salinarimonas soli TaxID=1638099 RepID=A0A5B2VE92_9HYPH|nr:outer membrane beta-barrel protein [Salinarimonas soli]KAA2236750.1 porin family protein [Salinarimonas soli]
MRILSIAVLAAGLSSPVLAADLDYAPLRGTQYGSAPASVENWEGGYAGGFAGYTQTNYAFTGTTANLLYPFFRESYLETEHQVTRLLEPGAAAANAMSFGAFAGYNVQFDEIVMGVEVDYTRTRSTLYGSGTDAIGRRYATKDGYNNDVYVAGRASAELREFATLRGRAGYTMGAFMPFVSLGLAVGQAKVTRAASATWLGTDADPLSSPILPDFYGAYSNSNAKTAWSLGVATGLGVDVALSRNAFLRTEWQYVRFTDFDGVAASINTVRAGAGLKF